MWKKLGLIAFVAGIFLVTAPSALAVKFDLVPPSGTLTRGQDVTFTINIDTQGSTVTSIQTGLTYDTQYLQYESAQPGAAMNSLTVDTSQGTGKLVFEGDNTAGFTGTGVYATVVFKLIADQAGSTELCTLWQPTTTPTPPPAVCNSACTSNADCTGGMFCYVTAGQTNGVCRNLTCPQEISCSCPQSSPPVPTALPQTGFELPHYTGVVAGSMFVILAAGIYLYAKKSTYTHASHRDHIRRKTHR